MIIVNSTNYADFIISIISTIIMTMMSLTREDPTMMRNGCLTLCQFNIPQDVLFDYERLVVMMMMKMATTIMMNWWGWEGGGCTNMKTLRQVRILLHIVSEHTSEENNFIQVFATKMKGQQDNEARITFVREWSNYLQRAGIFLLNSLACQVGCSVLWLLTAMLKIELV